MSLFFGYTNELTRNITLWSLVLLINNVLSISPHPLIGKRVRQDDEAVFKGPPFLPSQGEPLYMLVPSNAGKYVHRKNFLPWKFRSKETCSSVLTPAAKLTAACLFPHSWSESCFIPQHTSDVCDREFSHQPWARRSIQWTVEVPPWSRKSC